MTDAVAAMPAGALAAVAAVKDLGAFVVLVVGVGWVVWRGVPALVGFLAAQEKAMNAIVLQLASLTAELRAASEETRAHMTEEVTTGARHPLKDALLNHEREAIARDAALLARVDACERSIVTAVREEARDTRAAIMAVKAH